MRPGHAARTTRRGRGEVALLSVAGAVACPENGPRWAGAPFLLKPCPPSLASDVTSCAPPLARVLSAAAAAESERAVRAHGGPDQGQGWLHALLQQGAQLLRRPGHRRGTGAAPLAAAAFAGGGRGLVWAGGGLVARVGWCAVVGSLPAWRPGHAAQGAKVPPRRPHSNGPLTSPAAAAALFFCRCLLAATAGARTGRPPLLLACP